MFGLPLLQQFISAPKAPAQELMVDSMSIGIVVALLVLGLLVLGVIVLRQPPRTPPRGKRGGNRQRRALAAPQAGDDRQIVLIDGSNVMHWMDNTPQLNPLLQVVHDLSRRGMKPGVVFDANVGYKLMGKFMGERDLSRLLSLPLDQILVVPTGKQADPFLLETARDLKARIVTNDRFRDWTDQFPDVATPDKLVTGEMRDGRVWLKGMTAKDGAL
ncbi:hypothetical protein [Rhodobacter sp. SY28-1]|uniref:NYN domain-containing protein n=1 Tax=Rhodobacter sp. SY28-1 TaxID=2562317 RepID=UPI001F0E2ADF|nr:hypothetical protein [Rhodobacter sp. SY28-1]